MNIDGMESTERIKGIALITDRNPDERPIREPAEMYCRNHHLWARVFSGGFYFCVNCTARIPDGFLQDVIDGSELIYRRYAEAGSTEFYLILDDVFEKMLSVERFENLQDEWKENPRPAFFHSFILGANPRWDECKLDGRDIAASRAEVVLDPCEVPTVKLAIHANHLKEYLDKAKLDLAIIRRDGTEIVISEAAFVPRADLAGWIRETISALEKGDLDAAADAIRAERIRREGGVEPPRITVEHKFDAGELEAGITEALRALGKKSHQNESILGKVSRGVGQKGVIRGG